MENHYYAFWKPELCFPDLDEEGARRLRKVENALLSLCFSECQVTADTHERLRKYVSGELTWEGAFAELYGVESANEEAALWAQQVAARARTDSQWPD